MPLKPTIFTMRFGGGDDAALLSISEGQKRAFLRTRMFDREA